MSDFKNKNNVKKGSVLSKISFLLSIAPGVVLLVLLVEVHC